MIDDNAASRYGHSSLQQDAAGIGKEMQDAGVQSKAHTGPDAGPAAHTPPVPTSSDATRGQALGGHTQPGHPSAGYDSAAGRYGPTPTPEPPAPEPSREPGQ